MPNSNSSIPISVSVSGNLSGNIGPIPGLTYTPNSNTIPNLNQIVLPVTDTPNISAGNYFVAPFTNLPPAGLVITKLLGGEKGKIVYLTCKTGGAISLLNVHLPATDMMWLNSTVYGVEMGHVKYINHSTAGNVTLLENETIALIHNGLFWSHIGSRFVDVTLV